MYLKYSNFFYSAFNYNRMLPFFNLLQLTLSNESEARDKDLMNERASAA